jgi:glucokinase
MIGVDFGGTQIKAGVVEGDTIVRSATGPTPGGASPATVLDAVARVVQSLELQPTRVGLAIPGEVDAAGRCWRLPNVPGFEGVEIARELSARLGCPVFVENDATSAAYAELLFGHGRQHPSFVMLTLGTGIGGGVVIDGRLRRGRSGFAGEIGHVPIDASESAWPCGCGQRGCLEAYAGSHALLRRFAELGGSGVEVVEIAASARRGESAGIQVFDMMARALGIGLTGIQNVLDLDAIVFSGGISASFDLIEPCLRQTLRERAFARPLGEVPLLVSELGERAGVVGAAHLGAD